MLQEKSKTRKKNNQRQADRTMHLSVTNVSGDPVTQADILIANKIHYVPKVSVVMPVYNVQPFLRQCLDSVVNQTLKEIEIICVDDGSTDKSLDILKEYARKDNRITVIVQKNLHAGVARNAGLAVAKGEYVHFLDADDWIDVDTYEKIYAVIHKQKTDFMKFKSYSYDNVAQQVVNNDYTQMDMIQRDAIFDFEKDIKTVVHISDAPWSGIYNRKFLEKHKIRFDNFICSNDVGFYFRCLVHARQFYFLTKKFVYYRINNNKSLIGIRPFHFDCQINTFYRVHEIVKNETAEIIKFLDDCWSWSILWRFKAYTQNSNLPDTVKAKIRKLTEDFFEKNAHLKYRQDYLDYCNCKVKVSVIVPVHNVENYLRQCLDSIVNQTLKDIEIICVENGSTDRSLDILNEYAKKDERIRVFRFGPQKAGFARNFGVRMATGKYLYFIDSDDWVDTHCLEKLYTQIEQTQSDVCIYGIEKYDDQQKIILNNDYTDMSCFKERSKDVCNYKDIKNKIFRRFACYFELYNREFFIKKNLFLQEDIAIGEDVLTHVKSLLLARRICFCDENLYYYRVNRTGSLMATSKTNEHIFDAFSYIERVENFLIEQNVLPVLEQQFVDFVLEQFIFHLGRMNGDDFRQQFIQKAMTYVQHLNILCMEKSPYLKKFQQLTNFILNPIAVSVIVPVYSRESYLPQCLDSLIGQTLSQIEIICVNDGSKDNSLSVLKQYAQKDNRIIIINQKNQGVSCARNNAMKIAKGQYIAFVDSDDYLIPNALEKLYNFATQNNLDRVSFEGFNFIDGTNDLEENKYWNFDFLPKNFNMHCYTYDDCLPFLDQMPLSSCLTMYRRAFINAHHVEFPKGLFFEDNVFFIKALIFAQRSGILKERLYCRRIHSNSVTQNWDKHFADYIKIVDIVLTWLKANCPEAYSACYKSYMWGTYHRFHDFAPKWQRRYYKPLKKLFAKYAFTRVKMPVIHPVWQAYLMYPVYLRRRNHLLHRYIEQALTCFRIDIKNYGQADNALIVKAKNAHVSQPVWFQNAKIGRAHV